MVKIKGSDEPIVTFLPHRVKVVIDKGYCLNGLLKIKPSAFSTDEVNVPILIAWHG